MRFAALLSLFALVVSVFAFDNRYIVLLQDGTSIDAYVDKISAVAPVEVVTRWDQGSILHGVVVKTDGHTLQTLGAYPEVKSVERDQVITIPDCSKGPCRRRLSGGYVLEQEEKKE